MESTDTSAERQGWAPPRGLQPHNSILPFLLSFLLGGLQDSAVIFVVLNSDQLLHNTAYLRNSSLWAGFLACQQGVDVTAGKLSAQK